MECSINSPALSLLMKHLVIGQRLKTPNFSGFHWSPCGSLVSIGQHVVVTRVVHLPKSTKTSLITESDQSGPNHQLLQLCTARTAWSDLDQALRAVHSCKSWLSVCVLLTRLLHRHSIFGNLTNETTKVQANECLTIVFWKWYVVIVRPFLTVR